MHLVGEPPNLSLSSASQGGSCFYGMVLRVSRKELQMEGGPILWVDNERIGHPNDVMFHT